MLEVKGNLSELFKDVKDGNIHNNQDLIYTMLNRPITYDSKEIVGVITHVDIEKNEWRGWIYKDVVLQTALDISFCMGVEIV